MIIKSYEVIKKKLDNYNLYLFYGENIGLKKDLIKLIINIKEKKIGKHKSFEFEEEEILKNPSNFYNLIFSGSLFDQKKIIKINRASDKLFNLINDIMDKNIDDILILLNANLLEKKSKIRN